MGLDDDEDCPHVWVLGELDRQPPTDGQLLPRLAVVSTCALCGGIQYEPRRAEERPPLGPTR